MPQSLLDYVKTTFPTYDPRPLNGADTLALADNSVVATFPSVGTATSARSGLPRDIREGVVELGRLRSTGQTTTAPAPSAAARVRPPSNAVTVTAGAIVGGAIGLVVALLLDIDAIAVAIVAVFAAILGGLVGFYSAGMGWFRGERSDAERTAERDEPLGLLAALPHDADEANTIAQRLMAAGAVEVRIVDADGFWHAPTVD